MPYQYRKICTCGNVDYLTVNQREAAFGLRTKEIWNRPCSKCGASKFKSLSHPQVKLNLELLLEWARDEDLFLMEQDEDLILAEIDNLDLILEVLDNASIILSKRYLLLQVLCVMIFDQLKLRQNTSEVQKIQAINQTMEPIKLALKARKGLLLQASKSIMNYIRVPVFKELGI